MCIVLERATVLNLDKNRLEKSGYILAVGPQPQVPPIGGISRLGTLRTYGQVEVTQSNHTAMSQRGATGLYVE